MSQIFRSTNDEINPWQVFSDRPGTSGHPASASRTSRLPSRAAGVASSPRLRISSVELSCAFLLHWYWPTGCFRLSNLLWSLRWSLRWSLGIGGFLVGFLGGLLGGFLGGFLGGLPRWSHQWTYGGGLVVYSMVSSMESSMVLRWSPRWFPRS